MGALTLGVGLLLGAIVWGASEHRLRRRWNFPVARIEVPSDPASIARGARLTLAVAQCAFCHGADLGGREIADHPFFGRLHASNLTPGRGGLGPDYGIEDFVRAVRHGVDRAGRALALMPADQLGALGDEELASIFAFLRSVPPVDRRAPPRRVGPFTRLTLVMGLAPELLSVERIDHGPPPPPPAPEPTAAYGAYLVSVGGCRVCHHDDLSGGLHPLALPGEPPPPDLRPSGPLRNWSEEHFVRAMRQGVTPDGRQLDPAYMPWPAFAALTDLELTALWRYLTQIQPGDAPPSEAAARLARGTP